MIIYIYLLNIFGTGVPSPLLGNCVNRPKQVLRQGTMMDFVSNNYVQYMLLDFVCMAQVGFLCRSFNHQSLLLIECIKSSELEIAQMVQVPLPQLCFMYAILKVDIVIVDCFNDYDFALSYFSLIKLLVSLRLGRWMKVDPAVRSCLTSCEPLNQFLIKTEYIKALRAENWIYRHYGFS